MVPSEREKEIDHVAEADRKQNVLEKGSFLFRSHVLKALRGLKNLTGTHSPGRKSPLADYPFVWAESRTALRANPGGKEALFDLGKIINLQVACSKLHRRSFEADEIFSFWSTVGAPWTVNGFAVGREIREGCLIPTVGGGLCQISGSLFEVATKAGLEIIERHRHSSRLPGIPYKPERDATVFWNYIDLSFSSPQAFVIEARLTASELVIALRGKVARDKKSAAFKVDKTHTPSANDCLECGNTDCSLEKKTATLAAEANRSRLILLDGFQPEFSDDLVARKKNDDLLGLPLDGRRREIPGYAWPTDHWYNVREQKTAMVKRYLYGRLHHRSAIAAKLGLARAEILANAWKRELEKHAGNLIVQQSLVPFLWKAGLLQGREFEILLSHLPMDLMHERLEMAGRELPTPTLREFRADEDLVEYERLALAGAAQLVTAHAELKALFPRARKLDWKIPQRDLSGTGTRDLILFPGPTGEREGASTVREIARRTHLKLLVLGSVIESGDFWAGVSVERGTRAEIPWHRVRALVHPTLFESNPRLHLKALANEIPVIGTAACGLDASPEFHVVKFGDVGAIESALANT